LKQALALGACHDLLDKRGAARAIFDAWRCTNELAVFDEFGVEVKAKSGVSAPRH
jgi:hypothetical protein